MNASIAMSEKTKVLIVEDEPAIAQDIAACLEDIGYDVVGVVSSAAKAIGIMEMKTPEIALLDISIQGEASGIDLAHSINERFKIPFVFLTSYSDPITVEKARSAYPYGYIVKPFKESDLAPAIEIAMVRHEAKNGSRFPSLDMINKKMNIHLTKMEYAILEQLWKGLKNKEIAEKMFLSINTIKSHCNSLYKKLGVGRRSEAINLVRRLK